MFTNHIKEAIRLNRMPVENIHGVKVYYRKSTLYLNLAWIIFVILLLCIGSRGFDASLFIFLFFGAFLIYSLTGTIAKIITKNPVFIVEDERIYYLKSNRWYSIKNYRFEDRQMGRMDWFLTFCMIGNKDKIVFSEKNLWLRNIDSLRDTVKWIQLPEAQKEKVRARRTLNRKNNKDE